MPFLNQRKGIVGCDHVIFSSGINGPIQVQKGGAISQEHGVISLQNQTCFQTCQDIIIAPDKRG